MKRLVCLAVVAALLSGCATLPKLDPAADIHAFLVSIRDGDRTAFEAHVDRDALKTQLRARVLAETAAARGPASTSTLGAFLAGPLVDVAVDALLGPEVFRAVAQTRGYTVDQPIPGVIAIAQFIKPLGAGLVCVATVKNGPCVLDFKNEDGVWRLTGFEGDLSLLRPRR